MSCFWTKNLPTNQASEFHSTVVWRGRRRDESWKDWTVVVAHEVSLSKNNRVKDQHGEQERPDRVTSSMLVQGPSDHHSPCGWVHDGVNMVDFKWTDRKNQTLWLKRAKPHNVERVMLAAGLSPSTINTLLSLPPSIKLTEQHINAVHNYIITLNQLLHRQDHLLFYCLHEVKVTGDIRGQKKEEYISLFRPRGTKWIYFRSNFWKSHQTCVNVFLWAPSVNIATFQIDKLT